jgi:magnesium transporter
MINRKKKKKTKVGTVPGAFEYTGERKDEPLFIEWIQFDEQEVKETRIEHISDLPKGEEIKGKVNWFNIPALHGLDWIKATVSYLKVHPLSLEDALNIDHSPKVDLFEDYIFITLKMLIPKDENQWAQEHISLFVGNDIVISLQEYELDVFDPIRERIKAGLGRLRRKKADYLAYALLDILVDSYFTVVNKQTEQLYKVQEQLIQKMNTIENEQLAEYQNDWMLIRQAIIPFKTSFSQLSLAQHELIDPSLTPFFQDLADHLQQLNDELNLQKELLQNIYDQNMSNLSHRTNEVMRKLTVIATIFIPLTFIAGVYGMNFTYMPELNWKWGYAASWILMVGMGLAMYQYIKKI